MEDGRKTNCLEVGAGQVREDPQAAAFEFEIRANEEELNGLRQRFDETAGEADNAAGNQPLRGLYRLLRRLGTEQTKRHIESLGIPENQGAGNRAASEC